MRAGTPLAMLLSATLLSALLGAPLAARRANPFAYTMHMTPEDAQADPVIEKRYTARFTKCQKVAVITRENAACFEAEFARQDAVLNRVWKATSRRLKAERGRLLAAQRKWISERDPFCKSIADGFQGGTIAPVVYSDCRVEQTIRRTLWLEGLR